MFLVGIVQVGLSMRPLITWMSPADNAILDFLSGHQIENFCAPPKVVAVNTEVSASHVRKRVLKLYKADLLKKLNSPQGYYRVTDLGKRYLAGELAAEEGERLERFDSSTKRG